MPSLDLARCKIEDSMIFFPHQTVSMHVDHEHLALRVFSEPEPDPEDWELASHVIAWAMGGLADDYLDDDGLQVFVVSIVPEALAACRASMPAPV